MSKKEVEAFIGHFYLQDLEGLFILSAGKLSTEGCSL